ncbi:MAG: ABC transporter permease [Thermotogae bacterium]|nr:MAG: ABC transporter permease [Thermotogota bacterium]
MSLKNYVITRILLAIPMMFILLALIFFILRIMPGDPVLAIVGGKAPQHVIEQLREQMGLNKSIPAQFVDYVLSMLKGDLGKSTLTNRPVLDELKERLPATIELTAFAFVMAVLIGTFWGAEAARKKDRSLDVGARMFAIVAYAIPVFWLGLMMQLLFGMVLKWLPVAGRISPALSFTPITGFYLVDSIIKGNWAALWDAFKHLIMPGVALGLIISSIFLRMVRNNTVLMLSKDFVKAAVARGIRERAVLYGHALKNAFVPILTIMGLQLALLLAGAVLTETTFSWPGVGSYLVQKIRYRDFPAIQGTIVIFALIVIVISICVDIINALVDPRVRY